MEIIHELFGQEKDINTLQMSLRAVVLFFLTLLFIRIAGGRSFGLKTAFDNIIVIMLGATMSRAVTGASPFVPTVAAGLVMVVVHRLLGLAGFYNKRINHWIKGAFYNLYQDGKFDHDALKKCSLTEDDVLEEVRINTNADKLDKVQAINMERSGKLSIIKKE